MLRDGGMGVKFYNSKSAQRGAQRPKSRRGGGATQRQPGGHQAQPHI